jgi:hypothetical protein
MDTIEEQPPQTPDKNTFQPRVEAEEGDPNRGDYVIGVVIAVVVAAALLWALGVINV